MKTIKYNTIDKTEWPTGEWQEEPDKKQWTDKTTGLPCLIVRGPVGALCGYVGIGSKHPAYGNHYDDVDIMVHGGLTFSSKCNEKSLEGKGICHKVESGENDDVWWLGFDCSHAGDICPGSFYLNNPYPETYKNINYVTEEVESLALQLKELAKVA